MCHGHFPQPASRADHRAGRRHAKCDADRSARAGRTHGRGTSRRRASTQAARSSSNSFSFRAAQLASGVRRAARRISASAKPWRRGDGPTAAVRGEQSPSAHRCGSRCCCWTTEGTLITATQAVDARIDRRAEPVADGGGDGARTQPHVMAIGGRPYQFFVAPVRAPELIGYVAMGFADRQHAGAKRMSQLVGAQISLVSIRERASMRANRSLVVHSKAPSGPRSTARRLSPHSMVAGVRHHARRGQQEYLSVSRRPSFQSR